MIRVESFVSRVMVVESCFFARRDIGPLGPVAFGAGKAKELWIVSATVLLCNDMLNMERQKVRVLLVKPTVFTGTPSPISDECPEGGVHHSPWELARSWRALDLRMATNVPNVT
jgi:hypothetical protein